ncbi:hypothetical protein NKR23_g2562 [Pleurostoma richardsiae]|uniref:Uncharacterized protein n=1 Tax=Pleurostoma richardsiae TaxID=41990 RepID=A0AA38SAS0_9PEZI|nr:hypothetical protein NKR23_g2562 [Pleurostoma richardsiae]
MSAGRPASDEFGATPTVFSAEPVGGATEELVSEPQSLNEPVQLSEAEEDQEEDHTSTGSGSTPQILITGCDPNPPDTLGVSHAWRKEFMNERRTNRSLKRKHDKLEETLQTLWDAVRTYSTEDMSLDLPQRLELTVHFLVRDRIAAQIQLKDLQGYVDYWKEQADKDRRRLKATKAEVKRLKNLVRTAGPSPEATPLASGAGWYAMEVLSAP